ncbi:MAG: HAD-IIIA family hydrolase [Geobacteraceae bacterium]|nr:HAD-IIIA family hydrolase [Geobacteraceae bacterium]
MTIGAVLFDLDGTLVDSLEDLTDAVNYMLADVGQAALGPSEVRQLVGKGARNLVQRALATNSAEALNRGLAAFTEFNTLHITDKSRLYPGVLKLLQQLAADGIRMAVISNKNEALSRLILKALEIDTYFDMIAGGDTFAEMKPSPLPLRRVIATFNCSARDVVMVGDSINDIQAGNLAGIATIGCTWGYGSRRELSEAGFLADSCSDIITILQSWD